MKNRWKRRLITSCLLLDYSYFNYLFSIFRLDNQVKFGRSETCDVVLTSTHGIKNGTRLVDTLYSPLKYPENGPQLDRHAIVAR